MAISLHQLAFDILGLVVAFGIGFLIWTFAHLLRESHPPRPSASGLYERRTPRP